MRAPTQLQKCLFIWGLEVLTRIEGTYIANLQDSVKMYCCNFIPPVTKYLWPHKSDLLFFNRKKKIQPHISHFQTYHIAIHRFWIITLMTVSTHHTHPIVFCGLSLPHTTLLSFYLFVYTLFICSLTPTYVSLFSFKFILLSPPFQFCSRLTMVVVHSLMDTV